MRIGEGTIEEIKEDGLAKIKVSRDFLYVACSACAGAEHVMITAYNGLGAQEGNRVRYEVDDSHLAMSSFICFMMPLLLAAAGAPGRIWPGRRDYVGYCRCRHRPGMRSCRCQVL